MAKRSHKILIVEPDPDLMEVLVGTLSARFDAHVTCVASADSCLDVEMIDPHDLVIAELESGEVLSPPALPDPDPPALFDGQPMGDGSNGLLLAERLMSLSSRPIILLADDPTCADAVEALRLGVRDLLRKPFPVEQLLESAERAIEGFELRRQHLAKYHRMRKLLRRVIGERRDLNQRIELICRDLVGAHRRLVDRVLVLEESHTTPQR